MGPACRFWSSLARKRRRRPLDRSRSRLPCRDGPAVGGAVGARAQTAALGHRQRLRGIFRLGSSACVSGPLVGSPLHLAAPALRPGSSRRLDTIQPKGSDEELVVWDDERGVALEVRGRGHPVHWHEAVGRWIRVQDVPRGLGGPCGAGAAGGLHRPWMVRASVSSRSLRRAASTTFEPRRARASAVASPMPDEAPVTTATAPFSSMPVSSSIPRAPS
jgi:hypothetical protein